VALGRLERLAGALTWTLALLAIGAAHATHVAFVESRRVIAGFALRHRDRRRAVPARDLFLWFRTSPPTVAGKVTGVILVLWVTVTLLLGACRRLDPVRKGAGPSPVLDLVRHCIACGSTRVVLDAEAGADVVRCEACGARFVASSRPQAP
jgi:DNA-directed RNA polymerase subunit RPC12/RpoP